MLEVAKKFPEKEGLAGLLRELADKIGLEWYSVGKKFCLAAKEFYRLGEEFGLVAKEFGRPTKESG
jgi:hypothetical protein